MQSRELAAKAGVVGIGRGLYVFSLLILNVGFARSMGVESFGSFQQVFMFSAFFIIVSLGIPETLYYFLPRLDGEERSRFIGQTIVLLALAGAFVGTGMAFGADRLAAWQHNPAIATDIRWFGLYGGFLIAASFADPLFITFGHVRRLFAITGLHAVFFVVLTIVEVKFAVPRTGLFIVMAAFGVVRYVLTIVLVSGIRADMGPVRLGLAPHRVAKQLAYSAPVAMTNTVDVVARWLDKFVVSLMFGPALLGVFFVGAIEIPFVSVVVSSVFNVAAPAISASRHTGDIDGIITLARNAVKLTAGIIWPLFAYLFVFADSAVPLVFSTSFTGAVVPFRVYLLLLPLRIVSYGTVLIALGRSRAVFWTTVAALAVNAFLTVTLARIFGFIGPAFATVISTLFHIAVFVIIIVKELGVGPGKLLPVRRLVEVAISGGLAVATAFSVTRILHSPGWIIAVSLPVFVCVYLVLGTFAGFIRPSDIGQFAGGVLSGGRAED